MAGGVEKDKHIREVWADNLEEEMEIMRNLIDDYPYLSMVRTAAAEVFSMATELMEMLAVGPPRWP